MGIVKFRVVRDDTIQDDVILGMKFMKEKNVRVDMERKKISMQHSIGCYTYGYLNEHGNIIKIMHENVPVFAGSDGRVESSLIKIPVVNSLLLEDQGNDQYFYFEGKRDKKGIQAVDGVLEVHSIIVG